ncbi:MAG: GAF domain-containing sensor histidine kinase [Anaerolineae bacterium]
MARNLVPELVLNVYEDPDYIPTIARSHAQITLPLVTQDRLIGILNVQTNEPDLFSLSMFEFLQLLAARIASAIDNARLHQQTAEQLAELKQLYQQVSELEQLKTQMIRIAAHDLRNPLGVVNGFLQLLESELSSYMTERNYEQVDAIKEGVKRIDKITRDILTLERMSAGQEIVKEPVDIRQLVVHAFEESRPQAVAKKHDYGLDIQPEPIIIRGDRYLLPETITNLIINAIKYTPEGGQVTVRLTMEGQQVTFTVQDNGYGIPADQQNNLFQPFYRVKTKETRTIKGTGLGLHLVKTVIERHNGQMCFESEYGKGSTFGFNLPLMKTELPKRKRSSKTKRS